MFYLFISGTEISKIPGLSAAGANPDIVPLTSPADADVVQYGFPKSISFFPMDPQGHPTPAIITRAAVLEANIPVMVLRAGSYLPPHAPYFELGADFGRDPRLEPAVPDAQEVFSAAYLVASALRPETSTPVMLAESVPGGTTTALMALWALGYQNEMVSSASPENPTNLKRSVWQETEARIGAENMKQLAGDPLAIVRELGDPMQAAVLGFMVGLGDAGFSSVTLAGGTQMLAVAALFGRLAEHDESVRHLDIEVATTCYVADDPSSTFKLLAERLGVKTVAAQLDFSKSQFVGLSDYEIGFVKEGVGAGGAVVYAERCGVSVEDVILRTNQLYAEIAPK